MFFVEIPKAYVTTDKGSIHDTFLFFLNENICCGTSNEYPQHMFSLRNKKDVSIFQMKKVPYLLL